MRPEAMAKHKKIRYQNSGIEKMRRPNFAGADADQVKFDEAIGRLLQALKVSE